MITFNEMIRNVSIADVPLSHQINIQDLLKRVNVLRTEWAKPMIVTSGYRTEQDHLRIYHKLGVPRDKIPMGSAHLIGKAVDIYDPDLSLTRWFKEDNSKRLVALDLYCEEGRKNWVHITTRAPKSGARWFWP